MASRKLSNMQRTCLVSIRDTGQPRFPFGGNAGGRETTYRSLVVHGLIEQLPAQGGKPGRDKLTAEGREALKTGRYAVPPRGI